jgi:sulfite reductase alpha subunit-like flavoprotein
MARNGENVGKTILFFGCRKQSEDFLYEKEWEVSQANTHTISPQLKQFS